MSPTGKFISPPHVASVGCGVFFCISSIHKLLDRFVARGKKDFSPSPQNSPFVTFRKNLQKHPLFLRAYAIIGAHLYSSSSPSLLPPWGTVPRPSWAFLVSSPLSTDLRIVWLGFGPASPWVGGNCIPCPQTRPDDSHMRLLFPSEVELISGDALIWCVGEVPSAHVP